MADTIVDVEFGAHLTEAFTPGQLQVVQLLPDPCYCDHNCSCTTSDRYNVLVNGEVKHPNCSAEDVMRALGHYIHSQANKINQLEWSA